MSIFENNALAEFLLVPERFYNLFNVLLLVLLLVVLLLKGLALWRSARLGQRVWFWIFMFVNTLGILEIVYLIAYRDGFNKDIKKIKIPKERKENKEKPEEKKDEKKKEAIDLAELKNLDMNNWVS